MISPIYSYHDKCLQAFTDLLGALELRDHAFATQLPAAEVNTLYGRYKVWAGNVGAHQLPEQRTSLDYRLRDAQSYREHIVNLLEDLEKTNRKGNQSMDFSCWLVLTLALVAGYRD
jgi:hypothetical protein